MNNTENGKKGAFKEGQIGISHKGIGKVLIRETGEMIEIPHSFLRTALNGDTVKVLLHPYNKKDETDSNTLLNIHGGDFLDKHFY
jgi:hypothetical protein